MRKSLRNVFVLLFIIFGIGLAVFAYYWFSGRLDSAKRRPVVVVFDDITGLRIGDPVEVMGVPAGKVLATTLEGRRVRCLVGLDRSLRPTEDTKFAIRSVSYLSSDRYLMVTLGTGAPAPEGFVFEGRNEALNLDAAFLRLDRALSQFDPSGLGKELGDEVETRARALIDDVTEQLGRLGASGFARLGDLGSRLDRFNTGFAATTDQLGKLSGAMDTLRAFLSDSSSAGKLLKTDELYEEVRQTNQQLQELLADIKKNPSRYFHVKLF